MAVIDVTVAGIPCQVGVIDFVSVDGSYSRNGVSDMDYSGYSEMSWELLDRKGYVAGKWLTSKVNSRVEADIEEKIYEEMTTYVNF